MRGRGAILLWRIGFSGRFGGGVRVISAALFEDVGQAAERVALDEERYRRFVVTPLVDVFDEWTVILVDGERESRVIWFLGEGAGVIRERRIPVGEFDRVQRGFVDALG
jgi:hypothetical protein